jgi:hypothetical protein
MTALSQNKASTLWIMLLTAVSTVTTLALACATPFPALAALAAIHMRKRDGVALVLLAWAASQMVGFCVHDYPRDASSIGWAVGLATAAGGAVTGAYAVIHHTGAVPAWFRTGGAYLGAFVMFKLVVLFWAMILGGAEMAFAPAIVAKQFVRYATILIALMALYRGLTSIGVPIAHGATATA